MLDPAEAEALAKRCWRSPAEFARIFLADWFPNKMPWVHRGIAALMTGQTDFLLDFGPERWRDELAEWTPADLEKILSNFITPQGEAIFVLHEESGKFDLSISAKSNVALVMPRGFSKTTLINAINLRDALYKNLDFFLYVSESGPHAARQLGTIKREMETNELILAVFGDLVPGRQESLKWTEDFIETRSGIMVGAAGRGGQVRGFGKSGKRPARIVADDLEDEESVQSESMRKKDSTWFFGTLVPAMRKSGQVFAIGTLLHSEAILSKLGKSSAWTWVRFAARDRQGEPLWAWMMDNEAIERKRNELAEVGELGSFYLEYMSEIRNDDSRIFPVGKLIRISKPHSSFVGLALACDPAISDRPSADFCSFAVVGIEAGGVKHVVDFFAKKGMDPADQVDKFFELHAQHLTKIPPDFRRHGIEAIAYQRALLHLIKGEQFRRSATLGLDAYFEIIPLVHGKTGKEARVQGILKPLYHSGYLTFQTVFPELESQLELWPNGKKDGPDVVAMAVSLLDPFAILNLPDGQSLTQDNAPPLERVIGGSFHNAP